MKARLAALELAREAAAVRILLVSEIFPPKIGGSGRWFWEIYSRLPRRRVLIAAGQDPCQYEFDKMHDLHVERLPLSMTEWGVRSLRGLGGYWKATRLLRRLVARFRPNVVHCGRCLPEGIMALVLKRWTGLPYLCYVHGEDVRAAATSREQSWLVRQVLRNAALLIVNSRSTQRILAEEWKVAVRRTRILYPGVDTTRYTPVPPDPEWRTRWGWSGRRVILTVGRLQKRKGQDKLIEAISFVRNRCPDVLYVIVGSGEERHVLERLAASTGVADSVQFLGELDDTHTIRCYQQCDLFALPNRQVGGDVEGFGMVLLEAQACGKPVLAGASGGTAETMCPGTTGVVVDCTTAQSLADALTQLLSNPARLAEMGVQARSWVKARFDWARLAEQAELLFAEVGDPSRRRLAALV